MESKTKKMYVLDTNVFVHDPNALFVFEDSYVGIPSIVLEELDKFKKEPSGRGRNTREIIRHLDMLREQGSLSEGVTLKSGSIVRVLFLEEQFTPAMPFKIRTEDNEILLTALSMVHQGFDVKFISKDLNARVKADALGIATDDYLEERVTEDSFYKGWTRIQVPAVELKKNNPESLKKFIDVEKLEINEFVLLESQHNPFNYQVFRHVGGGKFITVKNPTFKWPLTARNAQQLMALDLLLDDTIQLVSLFGPAGTGKTFLTLLAGLHKVLVEDAYKKLLISRPVVPLGRDLGYLPGTLEEKLHSWMLPIFDNMDFIVHASHGGREHRERKDDQRDRKKHGGKRGGRGRRHESGGIRPLDDLIHHGKLSLEAITYMRGRSIPYQFIFIDEVQNLSPHEVKTLVSRVGEGSKIILTGDPYQIDSPYLDFSSNGLVVVSEKFKNNSLFGTVYLETSERSELSKLAGELL